MAEATKVASPLRRFMTSLPVFSGEMRRFWRPWCRRHLELLQAPVWRLRVQAPAKRISSNARSMVTSSAGLCAAAALVRWNCGGRVRAHHNPKTGIAQVTFDPLPGGIELADADKLAQSGARLFKDAHVASAWYGFGVPIRDPAELVVTLRNAIGGELRHAPAQRGRTCLNPANPGPTGLRPVRR